MSVSLSVVVPCFNAAAYLDAALRSVALQAVPDVEVIVIDDGSTDGSAEIARRHSPSVRLVQQEHQGISASRNRGIELSRGEIVGFLDADDLLPPESLRSRLDVLASFPEADGATGLVKQFISPELNPKERVGLEVSDAPSCGRVAGAMLLRRAVFKRVGGFDSRFRLGETLDWVSRADAAGVSMRSVDEVVLLRRIHAANSVRRATQLRSDYLRVLKASIDRQRRRSGSDA